MIACESDGIIMSLILAHGLLYAGSSQRSNAAIFQISHHHGLLRLSSRTGYTSACKMFMTYGWGRLLVWSATQFSECAVRVEHSVCIDFHNSTNLSNGTMLNSSSILQQAS